MSVLKGFAAYIAGGFFFGVVLAMIERKPKEAAAIGVCASFFAAILALFLWGIGVIR